jgi:serine phosphatase RsbU (regulator of sigma subunit)
LTSLVAPVGMFPDWSYEESAVQLNPGDLVLAYTDGVVEAVNPAGEEWGVEGLRRAAAESDEQRADDIHTISHLWTNFREEVRRMMLRSWSCGCIELFSKR